jgi:hypothetical protein
MDIERVVVELSETEHRVLDSQFSTTAISFTPSPDVIDFVPTALEARSGDRWNSYSSGDLSTPQGGASRAALRSREMTWLGRARRARLRPGSVGGIAGGALRLIGGRWRRAALETVPDTESAIAGDGLLGESGTAYQNPNNSRPAPRGPPRRDYWSGEREDPGTRLGRERRGMCYRATRLPVDRPSAIPRRDEWLTTWGAA